MRAKVLAAAVLLALALPTSALAHAVLLQWVPAYGARLATAPREVSLQFDQTVDAFPNAIVVRSSSGKLVTAGPSHTADSGRRVIVPLQRLPKGAYTVRWQVTSNEGHVVSGVYTFGVRMKPPPPTEAYGAGGPTKFEYVARWGYFVGLALLVGGLAFRLLVLRGRPVTPALERRFYWVVGVGVVGSIELGILGFILRAADAFQLPIGQLIYGDLSPLARGTRFGTAFITMTLGFALVAAFLFLAWLLERTILLWPAFVLGLALCSGLSLSGHSAVDVGSTWKSELADYVHLLAACFWVGGLVMLAFVVWPTAPGLRREAFHRFSQLAAVLVGAMVLAGAYLAYERLPAVSDLWRDRYGQVLLIKSSLVVLALSWGALHHFVVAPALERGRGVGSRAVARSLRGESAVAIAILLVVAVLVDANPPAPRSVKQPTQALVAHK
jgi:copper transport protein